MLQSHLNFSARWTPLAAGLLLFLGSCTPRYDQDFDAFRRGQTTIAGGRTTIPLSGTILPRSSTTLPQGTGDRTTLPRQPSTSLPQNPR